jgi:NAD(P)H dehydrogenase (quinone)
VITVAGGTGLVGKSLTQALVGEGEQVRVLTRDPKAARAAFGDAKLEIVGVDFDDVATLRAGFAGSDKAYMSYGTSDRQVRDEIALIDAAIGADVPYLVNLSVGGAGGPHVDSSNVLQWHTEIDAYLATTGVAWTLVRPTAFTDGTVTLAANFVPSHAWGGHAGAGPVALIDSRDVAAVSAVILTEGPRRHAGKVYDISGPAAVTMDEVAGYISAALGTRVEYHARTEAQQRAVLEAAGLPGLLVDVLLGVDEITRDNAYAVPSPTVFDLTGHPPRSVKDWVDEHVSLFAAPAVGPIGEGRTVVIAKGSIPRPEALAPYIDDEMRVLRELKAEGVIKSAYRRATGPGFYLVLEGANIDAVRERVDTTLPFVIENVATLEYDEIYEI